MCNKFRRVCWLYITWRLPAHSLMCVPQSTNLLSQSSPPFQPLNKFFMRKSLLNIKMIHTSMHSFSVPFWEGGEEEREGEKERLLSFDSSFVSCNAVKSGVFLKTCAPSWRWITSGPIFQKYVQSPKLQPGQDKAPNIPSTYLERDSERGKRKKGKKRQK